MSSVLHVLRLLNQEKSKNPKVNSVPVYIVAWEGHISPRVPAEHNIPAKDQEIQGRIILVSLWQLGTAIPPLMWHAFLYVIIYITAVFYSILSFIQSVLLL